MDFRGVTVVTVLQLKMMVILVICHLSKSVFDVSLSVISQLVNKDLRNMACFTWMICCNFYLNLFGCCHIILWLLGPHL